VQELTLKIEKERICFAKFKQFAEVYTIAGAVAAVGVELAVVAFVVGVAVAGVVVFVTAGVAVVAEATTAWSLLYAATGTLAVPETAGAAVVDVPVVDVPVVDVPFVDVPVVAVPVVEFVVVGAALVVVGVVGEIATTNALVPLHANKLVGVTTQFAILYNGLDVTICPASHLANKSIVCR